MKKSHLLDIIIVNNRFRNSERRVQFSKEILLDVKHDVWILRRYRNVIKKQKTLKACYKVPTLYDSLILLLNAN